MVTPTRVIGSYLSPYVRKVLVCLDLKGVGYEIDPIVPFYGSDEFTRISPLRRVPVLIDDAVTLADSSVICEYLDERYPRPALLPKAPAARARARWLEEFAGSRLGEVLIWHSFNQVVNSRSTPSGGRERRLSWSGCSTTKALPGCGTSNSFCSRRRCRSTAPALCEAGAPVTSDTFGTAQPRRGVSSV